jgi:putative ABC transport system permease protein
MAGKTSMNLTEAIRIAVASLWAHKMRSVLTLLGVVIGVTSVIAVVSVVNGLNSYVAEKIFNLGADVFLINRGPSIITTIEEYEESQKRKKFHFEDYEAIRDNCKRCVAVAANLGKVGQVKYGTEYLSDANIIGFTHEMPQVLDRELTEGRQITQLDVARGAFVCDVGYDIVDKLLPGIDPVGQTIRIDTSECEIIGVGKKRGSVMGQSQDSWVIMPLTTYQRIYGSDDSVRLWVKAGGTGALESTMDEVRLILRGRRHVPYQDPDDFAMETNASFLEIWGSISGTFFGVTIGIASIALIVGGIVIMNIMLASVTERTHEIGIRKSLGARRRDILAQFLVEAATLSTTGALLGIAAGLLLARFVQAVSPLPMGVSPTSIALGVGLGVTVGIVSGVYPASRAAKLDPVAALRFE